MPSGAPFIQFWSRPQTRDTFLSYVPKDDLGSFRLTCRDFSVWAAPLLFEKIIIKFRASKFTKQNRMAALERIGPHVKTFHFKFPHGPETFLAPLLTDLGQEVPFHYEPYIKSKRGSATRHSIPTYGSWEITDLLVKQYSPLFHAAADVSSFIRAFSALPNVKHLKVSTPGQDPCERYRRSVVDYALISLRIAVERSNLAALDTLSLLSVHPSAALYLNPAHGFSALPNSLRRWQQIRKINIRMDAVSTYPAPDHLKLLHSYLKIFTPTVEHLKFRWEGKKGPYPVSLGDEINFQARSSDPTVPKKHYDLLRPLHFAKLRNLEVENIMTDASQISTFMSTHRRTWTNLKWEDTHFRTGTWDDALSPLNSICGNDKWKQKSEEVMDVPLMLAPLDFEQEQLSRVWEEHKREKETGSRLGLDWQKPVRKTRDLLLGTEEHMRKLLRTSVFSRRLVGGRMGFVDIVT